MIHYYRYLFVKMKVFNYSELHFSKGTFYKIHTLVTSWMLWCFFECSNKYFLSVKEPLHISHLFFPFWWYSWKWAFEDNIEAKVLEHTEQVLDCICSSTMPWYNHFPKDLKVIGHISQRNGSGFPWCDFIWVVILALDGIVDLLEEQDLLQR